MKPSKNDSRGPTAGHAPQTRPPLRHWVVRTLPPVVPIARPHPGVVALPPAHALLEPLDAWLWAQLPVASAISWQLEGGTITPWTLWSETQKADLRAAFTTICNWHDAGMIGDAGESDPDPPQNLLDPALIDPAVDPDAAFWRRTIVAGAVAWSRYTAQVALCLAAEINGWLPHSILSYSALALDQMFGCQNHFTPSSGVPGQWDNFDVPGGYIVRGPLTPAHPAFVFRWLSVNGLIGSSAVETITRVLGWCRNLSHISGPLDDPHQYYWPYSSPPPLRFIIEGTVSTDPNYPPGPAAHWTGGCGCTANFLESLLLNVNVAVQSLGLDGAHATPHFIAQQLYLSHGDDPYDGIHAAPASLLPIDEATFQDWFRAGHDKASDNVGRRAAELGVDYPGDALVRAYCTDLATGADHASGHVYGSFRRPTNLFYPDTHFFTVTELETSDLWTRLDALASAQGLLGPRIAIRSSAWQSLPSGGALPPVAVAVGQPSYEQFFVESVGTTALTIGGIAFAALQNATAWVSLPPPAAVAPTANAGFSIGYQPLASGPFSVVMTVASNDPSSGSYIVTISGTAV